VFQKYANAFHTNGLVAVMSICSHADMSSDNVGQLLDELKNQRCYLKNNKKEDFYCLGFYTLHTYIFKNLQSSLYPLHVLFYTCNYPCLMTIL
jgi:hypothetical protein